MSWNATVDRLSARVQHEALADDPYTRDVLYEAIAEITRLARRVPNPDDLRAVVRHAEDSLEQVRHLRDEGHVATFRKQVARVRAPMEEA